MPKCLKCEKEIEYLMKDADNLDNGGKMNVRFHYGSTHDMCDDYEGFKSPVDDSRPRHVNLLGCDKILAYICDNCFEVYSHLFSAFNEIPKNKKYEKVL